MTSTGWPNFECILLLLCMSAVRALQADRPDFEDLGTYEVLDCFPVQMLTCFHSLGDFITKRCDSIHLPQLQSYIGR